MSMALIASRSVLAISAALPPSRAAVKAFRASFTDLFVRTLRELALAATLTLFLADLIMGIKIS